MTNDQTHHAVAAAGAQLALRGVTKQFPGTLANDRVDLTVAPGEIHALLGENGAGKSTLVKIIYGVLKADAGRIQWQGREVEIPNPNAARRLGVGMVFQHFSLFEALSVAENIALGIRDSGDLAALSRRIVKVSEQYGLALDPTRHVYELSVGERQRIEIVRCLLQDPRLLIMDEPTSVLTPQEVERLFATLRQLAAEGCSILYISHKLEEIKALCHIATIMRQGRVAATCDPARESARSMAELMIGGDLQTPSQKAGKAAGAPKLQVDRLSVASPAQFGVDLKDVSLEVHAGEVLGIAGVAGNGQAELLAALTGETRSSRAGAVRLGDREVGRMGPRRRRRHYAAFVPEERLGHGAVPDMSLSDNAFLSGYETMNLISHGFISPGAVASYAQSVVDRFKVKAHGVGADAGSLSGGNLQKFIIGREIVQNPGVMIAAQPTWGVDAGAAAAIRQALLDLAAGGAAVLLISQDLDELFAIADRIAVINEGRLSQSHPTHELTVEQVGLLMGGLHDSSAPQAEAAHAQA